MVLPPSIAQAYNRRPTDGVVPNPYNSRYRTVNESYMEGKHLYDSGQYKAAKAEWNMLLTTRSHELTTKQLNALKSCIKLADDKIANQ